MRLMLDLQDRYLDVQANEFDDQGVPRFEDVYDVFMLLTENILGEYNADVFIVATFADYEQMFLFQMQENYCK